MEYTTALWLGVALFLLILVPYLMLEIRKGKTRGHTWFTRSKPRGHNDIGPDPVTPLINQDMDEARRIRQ